MRLQLHHLHGAGDASDASTPIWFSSRFCFFRIWSQKWAHRGPVTSILTNTKFKISKYIFSSNFQITRPGFHFEVPKQYKVATKTISYERYGEILFQKVALCYLLHFVQDGSSKHTLGNLLLHINLKNSKVTRPDVHLGAPKKRKVATKPISYERYGQILFQKVASGYLLHFVQDGSSKNAI